MAPVGEGDEKAQLRPTSDRVREAIFNLLINGGYGDPLAGARVLDLFAGTGALGLEALSRGAAEAVFVDNGATARALIKRNIALMRAEAQTEILRFNATKLPGNRGAGFDVIFLDPPYGKAMGELALAACRDGKWLSPEALIVWEESAPPPLVGGFDMLDRRKYGDTIVSLLRARI